MDVTNGDLLVALIVNRVTILLLLNSALAAGRSVKRARIAVLSDCGSPKRGAQRPQRSGSACSCNTPLIVLVNDSKISGGGLTVFKPSG